MQSIGTMLCRTLPLSLGVHALALGLAVWALPDGAGPTSDALHVACVSLAPEDPSTEDHCEESAAALPLFERDDDVTPLTELVLVPERAPLEDDALPDLEEEAPPQEPTTLHDVPLSVVRARQRPVAPPESPPIPPSPAVVRPRVAPPAAATPPRTTPPRTMRPRTSAPRRAAPAKATGRAAPLRVVYAPSAARYYPARAQRRGMQGTTLVVLVVDARGRVIRTRVERSSGYPLLDDAALALARAYRFSPGVGLRRTRLPVSFRMTM